MVGTDPSIADRVGQCVQRASHFRVRDLVVEESCDGFVVRGHVPTYHAKQLALHGALELLPSGRVRVEIAVD